METKLQSAQRIAYWDTYNLGKTIRKILTNESNSMLFRDVDTPSRAFGLITEFRKRVLRLRNATYALRLAGEPNCEAYENRYKWIDFIELHTSWSSKYRKQNYTFEKLKAVKGAHGLNGDPALQGWWELAMALANYSDDFFKEDWYRIRREEKGCMPTPGAEQFARKMFRAAATHGDLSGSVAVDIETSALSPTEGEILEIGLVHWPEGTPFEPENFERINLRFDVSSEEIRNLGTGAEDIHGISQSDIVGLPKVTDPEVQKILKKYLCSGKRLIMHNAAFEFKWFTTYVDGFFKANTDNLGRRWTTIDTMLMCKIAFADGIPNNRLESVINAVGLPYENAHTALADAMMTMIGAQGMMENLRTMFTKNHTPTRFDFGDYTRLLAGNNPSDLADHINQVPKILESV